MRDFISWFCMLIAILSASSGTAADVVTIAGTGQKGNSPDGATANASAIGEPYGLVVGPDGGLYVCEIANHLIRRIDLSEDNVRKCWFGNARESGDGGPSREASLNEPYEVRFDSQGCLVFVMQNAVVRRVNAESGIISTIAGTGSTILRRWRTCQAGDAEPSPLDRPGLRGQSLHLRHQQSPNSSCRCEDGYHHDPARRGT